ncbi:MAG TPA: hypothetical protein VMX35_13205 [Acidobacteriota bacterium]|nr:hypothetical protein [Acidobacteriota bacterium]
MPKSREELLAAIEGGRVTAELLPDFFSEAAETDEVLRLKALALALKTEPQAAGPYFSRLDPIKLAQAIEENKLEPSLISLAVRAFSDNGRLTEAALRHPRTPTPAMLLIAERVGGPPINALLQDDLRLILSPELARALARNKNLDEAQWNRLERLLQRMEEDDELKIRREMRPESLSGEDRQIMLEEPSEDEHLEETDAAPKRRESIYAKLMHMTIAEKALLALNGNREVRMMLARDPNQLVSRAVLRSPRLSEIEVSSIAQMREVDEEILRIISQSRRWLRHYQILKNLVLNPRTPVAIAMNLIDRLNNLDIRLASRDHNLPHAIKQAAMNIARRRGLR